MVPTMTRSTGFSAINKVAPPHAASICPQKIPAWFLSSVYPRNIKRLTAGKRIQSGGKKKLQQKTSISEEHEREGHTQPVKAIAAMSSTPMTGIKPIKALQYVNLAFYHSEGPSPGPLTLGQFSPSLPGPGPKVFDNVTNPLYNILRSCLSFCRPFIYTFFLSNVNIFYHIFDKAPVS